MSSITAGTSAGTALVQSGDTTGALVIKTGGSAATAATFNADQTTTLAQPLPVASGGTGATSLSGITVGTATSATTATNLSGGSGGTIPYQTSSGTTAMLAAGTSGYLLQSNGTSAPSWTPAPASAGTVTAVASGALSDGSMVILNSNGTVSVPTVSGSATFQSNLFGAASSGTVNNSRRSISGCYNSTDKIIVLFYINTSNSYIYAIAGKVSGGSIFFGTPTVISSQIAATGVTYGVSAAWDAINNQYFVIWTNSGNTQGSFARCTANTALGISGVSTYIDYWAGSQPYPQAFSLIISPTLNGSDVQAVIQYYSNSVAYTMYIPCTCQSSSPHMNIGTEYVVDNAVSNIPMIPCFGATSNRALLPYRNASGYPAVAVVTLNGMSGTINSQTTVTATNSGSYGHSIAYSAVQNKFFFVSSSSAGMFGAVITLSGTTPTIGTPAILSGFGAQASKSYSVVPYEVTGDFWVGVDQYASRVAVSGTTFTNGAINLFITSVSTSFYGDFFYNPTDYTIVCPGQVTPQLSIANAYTSTLTSTNFLGVSNAAYTNGQTATIQTVGSTDDAQSGLTPGLKYYVAPNATLTTVATGQPYAGVALSATKLVIKG